jgi:hypothetical protein
MKGKEKSALLYQKAWVGHIPEHFTGGSVLVSERGSSQMSVKGVPPLFEEYFVN